MVLAAGFSAATTLLLALSPDQNLRGMLFWLMGDLSFAFEPERCLCCSACWLSRGTLGARHLNVLSRGELQAAIVGLPVRTFRYLIFVAAALATALSVTTVGVIGFIGLVVPHLVRLVAGSDHRVVLPASALAGGALLVVADTLARTIMAPRQLPVGALTAAIGVPLFLILMSRIRPSATGKPRAFGQQGCASSSRQPAMPDVSPIAMKPARVIRFPPATSLPMCEPTLDDGRAARLRRRRMSI